jgi:hypothetical protein
MQPIGHLYQLLRLTLTAVKPGRICPYYFTTGQYTFGLRCGHDGPQFQKPPSYAAIDAACWTDYPKQLADSMFAKLIKGA